MDWTYSLQTLCTIHVICLTIPASLARAWKADCESPSRVKGGPASSTLPSASTATVSHCSTVCSLWAMVSTVQCENSVRSVAYGLRLATATNNSGDYSGFTIGTECFLFMSMPTVEICFMFLGAEPV